jgi:DNA repair exonuclease SbcCD nuclease subunit
MRFVHISDSHLGASGFSRRLSLSGYNQREEDICNSFASAVDQIIELSPDFVLHTGDLFHSVRPTNRIINFAIRQILRIVSLKIPMVIISGNHDTPKQRSVGSVFSFFEVFSPFLHLVYKNKYESIDLNQTTIHAIPHCLDQENFREELAKVRIDQEAKYNILMLHGVVAGIPEFSMGELSEQEIPTSYFDLGFDYVALGHYHRHCQVAPVVVYAGSTERLSLAELGQEKGFVEVSLESRVLSLESKNLSSTFHSVPTRDMIELPTLDAKDLDPDGVYQGIEERTNSSAGSCGQDIIDKIVRLKIINIPEYVYNSLDFRKITELKSKAFHFDLRFERKDEKERAFTTETTIGKLPLEFEQYVKQAVVENLNKDRLLELGLKYLAEKKMTDDE